MLTHRYKTIIGDIPDDWEVKSLKLMITNQFSGDWGKDEGEETISVIRSTNFTNDGSLDLSNVAIRYFPKNKTGQFYLKVGDILVERSGGGPDQPVGRIGFISQDMLNTTASNFVQVLRPDSDQVDAKFLSWVLFELQRAGFVERVQQQSTQMRNLNWRDYQQLVLPYPKVSEQHAIAATLKMADDAINYTSIELKAAQNLLRSLLKSVFERGVIPSSQLINHSKWITCPAHWSIKPLNRIAIVQSGFTMGRDLSRSETVTVPYVTVVNVQDGRFDLSNVSSVDIKLEELNTSTLRYGDILMTEGGDRDKLGRGGMWRGVIEPCSFQNHIFRIRLNNEFKPELFHFLIQTYRAKNYFYAHAKQSSNLCTINSRELKNWHVAIPPIQEQEKMIEILQASEKQCSSIENRLSALLDVKKSLLQNLLTGKFRILATNNIPS